MKPSRERSTGDLECVLQFFRERKWLSGDPCEVVISETVTTSRQEAKKTDKRLHMTAGSSFISKAYFPSDDAEVLVKKVLHCSQSLCETESSPKLSSMS